MDQLDGEEPSTSQNTQSEGESIILPSELTMLTTKMKLTISIISNCLLLSTSACIHQSCACIDELAVIMCRGITELPKPNSSLTFQVRHLIIEQSNLADIVNIQHLFPTLEYVKIKNSTVNCSDLKFLQMYVESDTCFIRAKPAIMIEGPRLPDTFFTSIPDNAGDSLTSFVMLFMLCILNLSSIIGYILLGVKR